MNQVYYDSYAPMASNHSMNYQELPPKEKDMEEVASFLLSLKHRSVTPEPNNHSNSNDSSSSVGSGRKSGKGSTNNKKKTSSFSSGYGGYQAPYSKSKKTTSASFPLTAPPTAASSDIPSVESLVAESNLVCLKDRDLVPDGLFVAMAQMRPCQLTQADRVGCYKNRELGFLGMCCVHCGGQPGFGRYYPNSVRSLAQTTTSQTILKHIGGKCRFCPDHVRNAVLELQRQQAIQEQGAAQAGGRPRYGSRKIFFQRVWARLHGDGTVYTGGEAAEVSGHSLRTLATSDEETMSVSSSSTPEMAEEDDRVPSSKKRGRFGALPTQKNKRSKTSSVPEHLYASAV